MEKWFRGDIAWNVIFVIQSENDEEGLTLETSSS